MNKLSLLSIDIGTSSIKIVSGCVTSSGVIDNIVVSSSVSAGFKKGKLDDPDELYVAIERALKRIWALIPGQPHQVIVTIPYHDLQFRHHTGEWETEEGSEKISEEDRMGCLKKIKGSHDMPTHQLVHIYPLAYRVDGVSVLNPVGHDGRCFETDAHLIYGKEAPLMILTRVLKRLNLHIEGLIYDGMSLSQLVLDGNHVMVDIGGRFTKVHMFKNRLLYKSDVIPIGGELFTSDLAHCLKISIPEAERLKIIYGDLSYSRGDDSIEISRLDGTKSNVKWKLVNDILYARAMELVSHIQSSAVMTDYPLHPIQLIGGGSLLKGMDLLLRQQIEQPVTYFQTDHMASEHWLHLSSMSLLRYAVKANIISCVSVDETPLLRVKKWISTIF